MLLLLGEGRFPGMISQLFNFFLDLGITDQVTVYVTNPDICLVTVTGPVTDTSAVTDLVLAINFRYVLDTVPELYVADDSDATGAFGVAEDQALL